MTHKQLSVLLFFSVLLTLNGQTTTERRKQLLEELTRLVRPTTAKSYGRVNVHDGNWEDWLRRSGELPPDYDTMPSLPELPDPLLLREKGRDIPVSNPDMWRRQREYLKGQLEHWVFGKMPPAPGNLRAVVEREWKDGEITVRDVRLEFGPAHRAILRIQVMIPPGKGPFPVFLTNHLRNRPWTATAVRRGYIACIYYALDPVLYGHEDDSEKFLDVYPEYDWSCLARWAWSGMRAVDYLYSLPQVDKAKIGITGHSRNGKQALVAAAFDERIAAVIPSSGNTGEGNPWRYTTDQFVAQTLEDISSRNPDWFHPRLRFFIGREHKLPVDQNSLMALVAPRGLMLVSAYSERQGNPWGFEQAYRSVQNVYRWLGHEERLALQLRPGEHETTAGDIEGYLDFFDSVFGRRPFLRPESWVNGYRFEDWQQWSAENFVPANFPKQAAGDFLRDAAGRPAQTTVAWEQRKRFVRDSVLWALGEAPAGVSFPVERQLQKTVRTSGGWLAGLYARPLQISGAGVAPVAFGDDLRADLYYPASADGKPTAGKVPVVIWLHPYAYSTGYSGDVRPVLASLLKRGFAVLAFDQIGFGTRVLDARNFYRRYPKWSLMGKMVADTSAAIDAVAALEMVDAARIYLAGYSLGAKVGLFTAALDDRVSAVAAVCGFDPLRAANPDSEGVRHYSHLHGLMPRLGFFAGNEARLPVDYDGVLALIAPRPVYVVAPTLDRYAAVSNVRREVAESRKVYDLYGREDALTLTTPIDFNRFGTQRQGEVFDWLARLSMERKTQ